MLLGLLGWEHISLKLGLLNQVNIIESFGKINYQQVAGFYCDYLYVYFFARFMH